MPRHRPFSKIVSLVILCMTAPSTSAIAVENALPAACVDERSSPGKYDPVADISHSLRSADLLAKSGKWRTAAYLARLGNEQAEAQWEKAKAAGEAVFVPPHSAHRLAAIRATDSKTISIDHARASLERALNWLRDPSLARSMNRLSDAIRGAEKELGVEPASHVHIVVLCRTAEVVASPFQSDSDRVAWALSSARYHAYETDPELVRWSMGLLVTWISESDTYPSSRLDAARTLIMGTTKPGFETLSDRAIQLAISLLDEIPIYQGEEVRQPMQLANVLNLADTLIISGHFDHGDRLLRRAWKLVRDHHAGDEWAQAYLRQWTASIHLNIVSEKIRNNRKK